MVGSTADGVYHSFVLLVSLVLSRSPQHLDVDI